MAESPLLIMLDEKKRRSLCIHFHVCIQFLLEFSRIFQFQGLVSSLPLFLGCTCLFREKNTSSQLQSHHLQASRLDVIARIAAALARIAGGLISRLHLLSRCLSGPGIAIETMPSFSGILLLGVIHGLTH